MSKAALLAIAAGLGGFAWSGAAQIAPPPGEAPPPTPTYVPPPPPPPRPPTQGRPAQPIQAKEILDKPYTSLVETDEEGSVKRLVIPSEIAAYRVNPDIDAETRAKVDAFLAERHEGFEAIVVEHYAIIREVDEGLIDQVQVGDRQQFAGVSKKIAPLRGSGSLGASLARGGLFTRRQLAYNQKIWREYQSAVTNELRQLEADPKLGATVAIKNLTASSIEEALYTRRLMLLAAADKIDSILPGLALPSEVAAGAATIIADVKAAGDDEARFTHMMELSVAIGTEKTVEMLKAVLTARPPAPEGEKPADD